jgi:hypothetical protein
MNPSFDGTRFSELVDQARRATWDVCEKARLVLRPLLPGISDLQRDNTHFSPRIMSLMLARTGDQLSPENRDRMGHILDQVEKLQPQLAAWMAKVRERPNHGASASDLEECTRALALMTEFGASLDNLLDARSR